MKFKSLFILFAIFSILFTSCGDELSTDMTRKIQPSGDGISINVDTFHISSQTVSVDYTLSKPDSVYLLGKYVDNVFGGTSGDIFTQFHYLDNLYYPYYSSSVAQTYADSTVLTLSYDNGAYFGDVRSSIQFKVYELKKNMQSGIDYNTNIDADEYVNFSKLCGDTVQPIYLTDLKYGKYVIRIKLTKEFTERFFNTDKTIFNSQDEFNNFFNGFYITTGLNSAALLKISDIQLNLYCHGKYISNNTTFSMPPINFPVTNESKITRVNRILHPQKNDNLLAHNDTNYVSAPANLFTRLRIPIGRIKQRIKTKADKDTVINSAIIKLSVVNKDSMYYVNGRAFGTGLPYASNLLLIKAKSVNEINTSFFKNKNKEDNKTSFISAMDSTGTSTTKHKYYYTFSGLNSLIKSEIQKSTSVNDYLEMYIVPVKRVYEGSSSSTHTSLAPSTSLEAVGFYSGKNKSVPLKIELVYSGF